MEHLLQHYSGWSFANLKDNIYDKCVCVYMCVMSKVPYLYKVPFFLHLTLKNIKEQVKWMYHFDHLAYQVINPTWGIIFFRCVHLLDD